MQTGRVSMKKISWLSSSLFLIGVVHFKTYGLSYSFSPSQGEVAFHAKGKPSFLSIIGKGAGVSGELKQEASELSGELAFDLRTLTTGIDLRDSHMKENYLNTKEFPTSTLKVEKAPLPHILTDEFAIPGKLTVRGVTRDVTVKAKMTKVGSEQKLVAKLPLKISEFSIPVPSYQGITVAEDVLVEVSVPVQPKP